MNRTAGKNSINVFKTGEDNAQLLFRVSPKPDQLFSDMSCFGLRA